jgi:hypothetical protein
MHFLNIINAAHAKSMHEYINTMFKLSNCNVNIYYNKIYIVPQNNQTNKMDHIVRKGVNYSINHFIIHYKLHSVSLTNSGSNIKSMGLEPLMWRKAPFTVGNPKMLFYSTAATSLLCLKECDIKIIIISHRCHQIIVPHILRPNYCYECVGEAPKFLILLSTLSPILSWRPIATPNSLLYPMRPASTFKVSHLIATSWTSVDSPFPPND